MLLSETIENHKAKFESNFDMLIICYIIVAFLQIVAVINNVY